MLSDSDFMAYIPVLFEYLERILKHEMKGYDMTSSTYASPTGDGLVLQINMYATSTSYRPEDGYGFCLRCPV